MLVIDERAQSYAEHIGLLIKSTHGAMFVGSNTAGANGVMTSLMVPGGVRLYFSGLGVRHPDGSQLQQVGLRPTTRLGRRFTGSVPDETRYWSERCS